MSDDAEEHRPPWPPPVQNSFAPVPFPMFGTGWLQQTEEDVVRRRGNIQTSSTKLRCGCECRGAEITRCNFTNGESHFYGLFECSCRKCGPWQNKPCTRLISGWPVLHRTSTCDRCAPVNATASFVQPFCVQAPSAMLQDPTHPLTTSLSLPGNPPHRSISREPCPRSQSAPANRSRSPLRRGSPIRPHRAASSANNLMIPE